MANLSKICCALAAIAIPVLAGPSPIRADDAKHYQTTVAIDAVMIHRFEGWMTGFRKRAASIGIPPKILYTALADLRPDPDVLRFANNQPEHTRTPGDYVTRAVSDERIEVGRDKLKELSQTLTEIEAAYGVSRYVLVAIWGLESNYGQGKGTRSVLRSLATLAAFDERRAAFWEKQLSTALRIVQSGDSSADDLFGSWAGAMGHTQFIPTTFVNFAVDHDGDGRRDIWRSEADALASAANYLKAKGWAAEIAWGWEVKLSEGYEYARSGLGVVQPAAAFAKTGVQRINGDPFPEDVANTSLILPQGASGPAFLITSNFRAILAYNRSVSYALAVLHLADRLQGGPAFQRAWPHVIALNLEQRLELQQHLVALGYDTGGVDGIIGRASVGAIRAQQRRWGMPEDGFADLTLLRRLQRETKNATSSVANPPSGSVN